MNNTLKNKVTLIGRVGVKPEEVVFDSGARRTKIVLATNENYKNKNGEWISNTQWHVLIAWGALAERAVKQLDKGCEIIIEGKLANRVFNGQAGEKRYVTEVELGGFMLLNKKVDEPTVAAVRTK